MSAQKTTKKSLVKCSEPQKPSIESITPVSAPDMPPLSPGLSEEGLSKDHSKPLETAVPVENGPVTQSRESLLMSHWLFSDDGPSFKPPKISSRGPQLSGPALFSSSALFTSAANIPDIPVNEANISENSQDILTLSARDTIISLRNDRTSATTPLASTGRRSFQYASVEEAPKIRRTSELDHSTALYSNESDTASCKVAKRECSARFLERTHTTTDKVVDYVPTGNASRITMLESWCRNCVLTNHDGSSLSPSMLSRLWNIYGNPFTVTYNNSEKFTFIKYSPCDDSITVGGINEVYQCFQQTMHQCGEDFMEVKRFDYSWMRNKYCLYTSAECRRFRNAVYKLVRGGKELKDAILQVQLPNPLTVIKKIIWCFHQEYDGKDSVLLRILHGDAPANSPVVVRVESIRDDDVCITDGQSILRSIAADCYVKQLIKSRRLCVGRKIQLHGITIDADASRNEESAVVQLSYNSISPAPKKPIGLQNTHSNGHIREIKGGAGRVAQLDVTVLGVMPPIFKVLYKCPETNRTLWMLLSEWEFTSQFGDPEEKPPVKVESVNVLQSMTVIDTIMLLRITDYLRDPQSYQKALVKSCAVLTLKNLDESILSMLKPGSRIKISNLIVQNSSSFNGCNGNLNRNNQHIGNYLNFYSTAQSRMDIKDKDTPLQNIRDTISDCMKGGLVNAEGSEMAAVGNRSIFRTLILGEPALSVRSQNEEEFFELMQKENEESGDVYNEMFLDQYCNVTGVLLDASDIVATGSGWFFFRLFILTTCFKIATIRISGKSNYPPVAEAGHTRNPPAVLEHARKRILSQRLTITIGAESINKKPRNMFVTYMNIQYSGYDEKCGVYNFQTTANKLAMRESIILKRLQSRMNETVVFPHDTGYTINYKAVTVLGDTDIDKNCRVFTKALARAKLKVCQLLNSGAEVVKLCEEVSNSSLL